MACVRRLMAEYRAIATSKFDHFTIRPNERDQLQAHFVIFNLPKNCPYHGGVYHGMVSLPHNYPFAPPAIYMHTPSGRFVTGQRLCFSMSDFHPESWNPAWRLETLVRAFVSFMLDESDPKTTGGARASHATRRRLALQSFHHNRTNPFFVKRFPEFADESRWNPAAGFTHGDPPAAGAALPP
eukprot:Polyplicarium_translucidae@DN389_c0_g1_i1.p1